MRGTMFDREDFERLLEQRFDEMWRHTQAEMRARRDVIVAAYNQGVRDVLMARERDTFSHFKTTMDIGGIKVLCPDPETSVGPPQPDPVHVKPPTEAS